MKGIILLGLSKIHSYSLIFPASKKLLPVYHDTMAYHSLVTLMVSLNLYYAKMIAINKGIQSLHRGILNNCWVGNCANISHIKNTPLNIEIIARAFAWIADHYTRHYQSLLVINK